MSSVLFGVSVLAVLVVSALIGAGLVLYSGTDWSGWADAGLHLSVPLGKAPRAVVAG